MHSIKKKERVVSKRVGKNALYRCFNCDKADGCKYLVEEGTSIRHALRHLYRTRKHMKEIT